MGFKVDEGDFDGHSGTVEAWARVRGYDGAACLTRFSCGHFCLVGDMIRAVIRFMGFPIHLRVDNQNSSSQVPSPR